jgi:hypothetical protein
MEQPEFLPPWKNSHSPKTTVAQNVVAIVLIIMLNIFTLGIYVSIQHLGDTVKRKD